jgi:predicted DCC family thiol-disulfide oxidoreductase YuxK
MPSSAKLVVVFDGWCGFCTLCAAWLRALDWRDGVTSVPCQGPGVPESVGVTRSQCLEAAYAREPGGRLHHGAAAMIVALAWAIGLPALGRAYYAPGLRQLADTAYGVLARNRARLPGIMPHCEAQPEACVDY